MASEIEDIEKLSILGLTINIKIGDESIIGEVFYYDQDSKLLILRENFAGGDSFNLRYVNCVAVNELRIVAKSSLEKIDTDLSKINYQELLNAEKKNMELIKKKTLIEDESVLSLFNDLNKQYPDSEWYGRSIYLPNLSILIKPPYHADTVEGKGDLVHLRKTVMRLRQKYGIDKQV